jgi:uncharacterized protein (TIGR03437 family)
VELLHMISRSASIFSIFLFAASAAYAQTAPSWDTSGNSLLAGEYRIRHVVYVVGDFAGNFGRAISLHGTIRFDGEGKYSLESTIRDSNAATSQSYSVNGTYAISSAGFGLLTSPVSQGSAIFGLVSQGIFIGSSTESGLNDLLIAAPASTSAAVAFQGEYAVAHMDFPGGSPALTRNSLFSLRPDGQGNIEGTVSLSGYIGGLGSQTVEQTAEGVRYTLENGAGTLTFPDGQLSNQTLIAGAKTLYISHDGNFVFGGSSTGWDLFVGVRRTPGSAGFGGLYYEGGISQDVSQLAAGRAFLETYHGALSANAGRIVGHQRIASPFNDTAFNYTYSGSYSEDSAGDPEGTQRYATGMAGAIRIGSGRGPNLGISLALKAPEFSGPGVFLNPAGVVNAASSAPFTTGLTRGQFITLYGTNLAPGIEVASAFPFPEELNGVRVTINGRRAPVYSVAPTQISVVVPYSTELSIARIEVENNGETSNAVTVFMNRTAPGVFTIPPGGIGDAAGLHADFSLVEPSSPARPGEIVALYVTGLGEVLPPVPAGHAAPASPLSIIVNPLSVFIDGRPARIAFAGLAPTLAGLYQINAEIPAGTGTGDALVEVLGPDSYAASATIPVVAPSAGPAQRNLRRRHINVQ